MEFVRRNDEVASGLTAPQFESLVLAVVGVAWLVLAARGGGIRREPGDTRRGSAPRSASA